MKSLTRFAFWEDCPGIRVRPMSWARSKKYVDLRLKVFYPKTSVFMPNGCQPNNKGLYFGFI